MQRSYKSPKRSAAKLPFSGAQADYWKRVLFSAVPLLALLAFFARWILLMRPKEPLGIVTAALVTFLFALVGLRFIPQWMRAWSDAPWEPLRPHEGRRTARLSNLHPTLRIICALVLFRLMILVIAYVMLCLRDGYQGGLLDHLELWNMLGSDSRHYLNIAENGYANSGDDRLLIVFLPLYPLLVRLFRVVFNSYLASGLFLSNLCCVISGVLLYELALLDYDIPTARRSLKYLCILPAAFLFSAPLSDALFFTLSLACLYLMRKRRYAFASIFGFFAAFTRTPGLILFAPLCFELVGDIIREWKQKKRERKWVLQTIGSAVSLLLIPCGFLLYLYVNFAVTGNPFMFLVYQSSHWHQNLGWFFSTVNTQTENLVQNLGASGNIRLALGLWMPNLVYIFASLALIAAAQQKLRASYVAYFILYFAVCMGATWLLSAPRYLTACFPLALALGVLSKKRWVDGLATVVCVILLLLYMAAYVNQWYVY